MNKIADYDTYDYDYSTYWNKREYEHKSEILVLEKLLKHNSGRWFLDIGGSFGRLTKTYSKRYTNPVIVDYSLKTLQKNYASLKKETPSIELIAANAYFLPFKNNTFDGSLMVRVLHHIEKPKECVREIYRVLSHNGIYIQEYANKLHIKAVIRAILTLDFSLFNKEPYQQPDKHHYEGTKEGSKVLFFNYHPRWIATLLTDIGYNIKKKYGCSFLRLNILKKLLSTKFLLFWENIFQYTLSWSNISPSIFIKSLVNKKTENTEEPNDFASILLCPRCKGNLDIQNNRAICNNCKNEYLKKENIWDFRI